MMQAAAAATMAGGEIVGGDARIGGAAIDSRLLARGECFVALAGARDGHDFVEDARARGAAAAMVSQDRKWALPRIVVADTGRALAQWAACWRRGFELPLAAITGSNGKTTVKEMLASILRAAWGADSVLASQGNLNNHLGVPLTLLRLRRTHRAAVVEMGMNRAGEIDALAALAKPTMGVITNAQRAHLGGFEDEADAGDAIARAKGELLSRLPRGATAVLNADDPHFDLWRASARRRRLRVVSFGFAAAADCRARAETAEKTELQLPDGAKIEFAPRAPGLHNQANAAAAAACAWRLEIAAPIIAAGLAAARAPAGRLQFRDSIYRGATIIDDAYNANPDSARAAFAVLRAQPGRKIAVLGGFGELGREAARLHRETGALLARLADIDAVCTVGEARAVAAACPRARHFESKEALVAALRNDLAQTAAAGGRVFALVKGSRAARMEEVVAALTGETTP